MHEHDFERVTAVAEGRLSAAQMAAVEADIASCTQCSRDLEELRMALTFIGEAEQPKLTDLERVALHRSVRQMNTSSRLVRLVPAFAAAAALVMVFGVVSLFGRGGSTETLNAPPAQELTTAGKSEADTSFAEDSARELAGAPAPAAATDDLPELAQQLRDTESPLLVSSACDTEALTMAEEAPLAVADVTIEGADALLYVYPDTALAFDAASCEFIRRIPAP